MTAEETVAHSAGAPGSAVTLPAEILEFIGGRPWRPVWENHLGSITVKVGHDERPQFVKWVPVGVPGDLAGEATRMRWAGAYTSVPVVVDQVTSDAGSWLVTEALTGGMAVLDRWKERPEIAVRAIGSGLRVFHDALPVADCPFSWSAEDRIGAARQRAEAGEIDPAAWHDVHKPLGAEGALAAVSKPPPVDELVVCHGDTCAPNLLIGDDGEPTGWVDLGDLGVADRWADLAIATWSTTWNYGPGWEGALLEAYGVEPDPGRTAYYRLLYDLGP